MSLFFWWRGGKGSRMVSFMYQRVIQHLWLMDSISEHIDVALYTEGQIKSNKALTTLQKYSYLVFLFDISAFVYNTNSWFGNTLIWNVPFFLVERREGF